MKDAIRPIAWIIITSLLAFVAFALGNHPYAPPAKAQNPTKSDTQTIEATCGKGVAFSNFVHYEPADPAQVGTPKISEQFALETAIKNSYVSAQLPAPAVKVQYVLFSDDIMGVASTIGDDDDADRHLLYQNMPAWIVTFCEVSVMPVSGPAPADGKKAQPLKAIPSDWNYVIDAMTGETIQQFASKPK
jgi:hypothetical protein